VVDVTPLDVAADDEPLEGATNDAATAKGSTLSLGAESAFGFLVLRSDAGVAFRGFPPNGRLLWMSFLGGISGYLLLQVCFWLNHNRSRFMNACNGITQSSG
jgi:hypothetical protein